LCAKIFCNFMQKGLAKNILDAIPSLQRSGQSVAKSFSPSKIFLSIHGLPPLSFSKEVSRSEQAQK
ncbi:MAG: hypothetical protein Q4F00_05950, partial [bacterium]|nr:hypothetical protein [bacterium]